MNGLALVTKKRREHLTEEDVKFNKAFFKQVATGIFKKNKHDDLDDDLDEEEEREIDVVNVKNIYLH